MKIQVTAKHIKNGQRNDPHFCPVALAIGEILRAPFRCAILHSRCRIYDDTNRGYKLVADFLFSSEITKKIGQFDDNKQVLPFEFDLPIEQYT
jgi:hypothetical protein